MRNVDNNLANIKVEILLVSSCCTHYCTHIEAIIDFPGSGLSARKLKFDGNGITDSAVNEDTTLIECSMVRRIFLYNKTSIEQRDEFLNKYQEKFRADNYNFVCNNCSDAVSFILDYFFPDMGSTCLKTSYKIFQFLFCAPFVLTCGLLPRCFPAACFINSPADVFRRAQLLSCTYGAPPIAEQNTPPSANHNPISFIASRENKEVKREPQSNTHDAIAMRP